tara:strand:- start:736 stop:990 length:255 start_codon:yes stop_codon:yes gene_type:complete
MMYWNHRITVGGEPDDYSRYEIIEVHYDDNGKIILVDDVKLIGDTKEELQEQVEQILKDIKDSPLLTTGEAYAHRNFPEENDDE